MAKVDFASLAAKVPVKALEQKIEALDSGKKALLFLATVIALSAVFYFLVYEPQSTKELKIKQTVSGQQQRLANLKQAAIQVDKLTKELEQSEAELAKLLAFLPDQREIPGLLENVSQLGSQVGLENILFQPQPEQIQEFYAAIPVRLDLVGSYHQLAVFLDKISKLHRILKVEELKVSRQQDSQRSLQVSCTVYTYRFIDKPVQAAAPAPAPAPAKKRK